MPTVRLTIALRLLLGFSIVLLLTVLTAGVGWNRLVQAHDDSQLQGRLNQLAAGTTRWMAQTELNVNRALAIIKANGAPEVEAHFSPRMKKTSDEITVLQKELTEALSSDAASSALLEKVGESRKAYLGLRAEALKMQKAKDAQAALFVDQQVLPAADAYLRALAALKEHVESRSTQYATQAQASLDRAETIMLAAGAACVFLGLATSLVIARSVTRPLREAVQATSAIAAGDLTTQIPSRSGDELGELLTGLARMQHSLASLVGRVREATDGVSTASSQVAVGGTDLSSRTEATAASLEQTAAAMHEVATTVSHTVESAHTANSLARTATELATRGGELVAQVVTTMADIDASSRKITDIIGVIDSIAFQTNILALNAAVEAARAGDQGRGFAVVASEVRSLAQRSALAAKEIKGLIDSSVERVGSGSELVAQAGRTMQDMVASVNRVSEVIDTLVTQAAQQNQVIGQIHEAIVQLDGSTQQNATLVEETSAAARSLQDQASDLSAAVGAFRLA